MAVDVFTQDSGLINIGLHPPVSKVVSVLSHLRTCKAEGSLVISLRKSACFLYQDGKH